MNRETCEGCPISENHVETDVLCNYCSSVEYWLQEHDEEVRAKAIDEFADKMIIMMPGHRQDILEISKQLKLDHIREEKVGEEGGK